MPSLGLLRHKLLYGLLETKKVRLTKVGHVCAWDVYLEGLGSDSFIISAGAGGDISFEVELQRATGAKVILLDPSPTGQATVARTPMDGIEFLSCGLAANSGTQTFALPENPAEGSYSLAQGSGQTISFACRSLMDLMTERHASRIDLLKMDIEGFEWGVLRQILDQRLNVGQICVEFHAMGGRLQSGWQRYRMIMEMRLRGYLLASHHGTGDHTFVRADILPPA